MNKFILSVMITVGIAALITSCQGHYNPHLHVDEGQAKPGHVKKKYYY